MRICNALRVRPEAFALGSTSRALAKVVAAVPAQKESEGGPVQAALLLIDRHLDLHSPSQHGDSLLARVLEALPRRVRSRTLY